MKRVSLLAVLVVVSAACSGLAGAGAAGEPALEVDISNGAVVPGERTTIQLSVANGAELRQAALSNPTFNDRVTTARGVTVSLRDRGLPVDVRTSRQVLGSLPGGATTSLEFEAVIDENATGGTYRIPVRVEYTYTDFISELSGVATEESVTETFTARLRVERRPKLAVVNTTTDLAAGERGVVDVTVENVGPETARATRLRLASLNSDITVGAASSGSRYLGTVSPGERRNVSYALVASDHARTQAYAFELVPTFEDGAGRTIHAPARSIGVVPRPALSFGVGNVSTDLRVGRTGTLSGSITNRGGRTARNAVVVVESLSSTVQLRETRYPLGDLRAGQSATFELDTVVPAAADEGPRQFVAHIEYQTREDVLSSDSLRFTASVAPARDRLRFEPVNASFTPDSDNRLTVRVRNVGDERLTDIQATVDPRQPFESEAPQSYVATLAPGESATVAFALHVSEDAVVNTHALPVNVTADGPDGDTIRTGPHLVPVQVVAEPPAASETALLAGAALLVTVILAAGWWWLRT